MIIMKISSTNDNMAEFQKNGRDLNQTCRIARWTEVWWKTTLKEKNVCSEKNLNICIWNGA